MHLYGPNINSQGIVYKLYLKHVSGELHSELVKGRIDEASGKKVTDLFLYEQSIAAAKAVVDACERFSNK